MMKVSIIATALASAAAAMAQSRLEAVFSSGLVVTAGINGGTDAVKPPIALYRLAVGAKGVRR